MNSINANFDNLEMRVDTMHSRTKTFVSEKDNVISGRFGSDLESTQAKELSIFLKRGTQTNDLPKAVGLSWFALAKKFIGELGFGTASQDAERKGKMLAENLRLQKEIQLLGAQINSEISELRDRGEKYVHVAETCGSLVNDAEYFVASNLLKLMRGRRKRS